MVRRLGARESSSAQMSCRLRVRASITTTAWRREKLRAISVTGTAPVRAKAAGVSSLGTRVTMVWPGLNPSERS